MRDGAARRPPRAWALGHARQHVHTALARSSGRTALACSSPCGRPTAPGPRPHAQGGPLGPKGAPSPPDKCQSGAAAAPRRLDAEEGPRRRPGARSSSLSSLPFAAQAHCQVGLGRPDGGASVGGAFRACGQSALPLRRRAHVERAVWGAPRLATPASWGCRWWLSALGGAPYSGGLWRTLEESPCHSQPKERLEHGSSLGQRRGF